MVPCYPFCHLLPALVNRGFSATVTAPFLFPWAPPVADAWRFLPNVASCNLSHEAFYCFKDPAIPLARRLTCNGPHLDLHPKITVESSVDPLVAKNALRSSSRHLCQLFPSITHLCDRPSYCRATTPANKIPRLADGRFDAFVSSLLDRLRVPNCVVVGTLPALDPNDSQED